MRRTPSGQPRSTHSGKRYAVSWQRQPRAANAAGLAGREDRNGNGSHCAEKHSSADGCASGVVDAIASNSPTTPRRTAGAPRALLRARGHARRKHSLWHVPKNVMTRRWVSASRKRRCISWGAGRCVAVGSVAICTCNCMFSDQACGSARHTVSADLEELLRTVMRTAPPARPPGSPVGRCEESTPRRCKVAVPHSVNWPSPPSCTARVIAPAARLLPHSTTKYSCNHAVES